MKIIILAGGGGTRLYPLSTPDKPKQFLKLVDDNSLLINTILRFLPIVNQEDIVIVTNQKYVELTQNELKENNLQNVNILAEPDKKNTAPAAIYAALFCKEKLQAKHDEVMVLAPSDHVISPVNEFCEDIVKAEKVAKQGKVVTFGVEPTNPNIEYGYIKVGIENANYFVGDGFTEKPDFEKATQYINERNYLWNAGLYSFTIETLLSEIKKTCPNLSKYLTLSYVDFAKSYIQMQSISIDKALAEKTDKLAVIQLVLKWCDIGSFESLNKYCLSIGNNRYEKFANAQKKNEE